MVLAMTTPLAMALVIAIMVVMTNMDRKIVGFT